MKKSVIITGASSGIGREAAIQLAGPDRLCVLSGRSQERLNSTADQVVSNGGATRIVPGDIQKKAVLDRLVQVAEAAAPLSGIVFAAGIAGGADPDADIVAQIETSLQVNLVAIAALAHLGAEQMEKNGGGQFIILNSVAGLQAFAGSSPYVTAKHALRGLADSLRMDFRSRGIRVTSIYPGATNTEWWAKLDGEFPLDLMLTPQMVAQAIKFAFDFPAGGVVEELTLRHPEGDF